MKMLMVMMRVFVKNQWRTNLANFVPRTYSSHSLAAYHCHPDDDDHCDDDHYDDDDDDDDECDDDDDDEYGEDGGDEQRNNGDNALWLSWKIGSKVVNFEKLFLHQFSTKIYQTLRDDV